MNAAIDDAIYALEMEGFDVYDYGNTLQVTMRDTTRGGSGAGYNMRVTRELIFLVDEIVNEHVLAGVYDSKTPGVIVVEIQ